MVFLKLHAESARATADDFDRLRKQGAAASPLAGIPVSIKDLFDIRGDVTTAGSRVLQHEPAARNDAQSVARLRAAGLILIGRTNMTEFAYSGLGLNPHFGTPLNPFERPRGRIPGGSSSGAAISITDCMAFGALGTDTGGSCRIPAAYCGIVGFKPTARRVPLTGVFPLSPSLDSVGPLAASVACCALLDAILADESHPNLARADLRGARFAVPQSHVLEGTDSQVSASFSRALSALSRAGAHISEFALSELGELPHINRKGGLAAAQAYAVHRDRLATRAGEYDPRVSVRILRGREQDEADLLELRRARADLQQRLDPQLEGFDAVLMPTTPTIAPTLEELNTDQEYVRLNALALRNPSITNFLDRCAISVPCHELGTGPVGLMLMGKHGSDRRLLSLAAAVEALVSPGLPEE